MGDIYWKVRVLRLDIYIYNVYEDQGKYYLLKGDDGKIDSYSKFRFEDV